MSWDETFGCVALWAWAFVFFGGSAWVIWLGPRWDERKHPNPAHFGALGVALGAVVFLGSVFVRMIWWENFR